MKKSLVLLGLLSVSGYVALAQIRISAGQTWSCEFISLPFVDIQTLPGGGVYPPYAGAHVTLSSIDPGTHYIFSIYENSLSDSPIWVTDSLVNQSASAGG